MSCEMTSADIEEPRWEWFIRRCEAYERTTSLAIIAHESVAFILVRFWWKISSSVGKVKLCMP